MWHDKVNGFCNQTFAEDAESAFYNFLLKLLKILLLTGEWYGSLDPTHLKFLEVRLILNGTRFDSTAASVTDNLH